MMGTQPCVTGEHTRIPCMYIMMGIRGAPMADTHSEDEGYNTLPQEQPPGQSLELPAVTH